MRFKQYKKAKQKNWWKVPLIGLNEKLILPSGYKWAGNEYSWPVFTTLVSRPTLSAVFQQLS